MTLSSELLAALREAGLAIELHSHNAGKWFAGTTVDDLDRDQLGPFEDDGAALVAGVWWLIGLARDARTERDAMWLDLRQTKEAVEAAHDALQAEVIQLRGCSPPYRLSYDRSARAWRRSSARWQQPRPSFGRSAKQKAQRGAAPRIR
jgi:hypothetical protein